MQFVACYPVAAPSLLLLVNALVPTTSAVPLPVGSLLVLGTFAVALILSIRVIIARVTPWIAGIAFSLCLAFTVVAALDQAHATFYSTIAVESLALSLPWLLVGNAVADRTHFLKYLHVSALIVVAASVIRLYFPTQHELDGHIYSQYDGYQVLPAAVIFADDFLQRPRLRSAALLVVAVVLLLAAGARGPLLALVLYGVARTGLGLRHRPKAVVVLLIVTAAFVQLFNFLLPVLLGTLGRLFSAQGFSTRAIDRLADGDFLEDRARGSLAHFSWDLILQHPLIGVGISRDRLLLADAMGVRDPTATHGWYPHNILLELLLQFGVIVGSAVIVGLAVLLIKAFLVQADPAMPRVVLIFAASGFFPLLVSGSYLTQPLFFSLVGFSIAANRMPGPARRRRPRTSAANT